VDFSKLNRLNWKSGKETLIESYEFKNMQQPIWIECSLIAAFNLHLTSRHIWLLKQILFSTVSLLKKIFTWNYWQL